MTSIPPSEFRRMQAKEMVIAQDRDFRDSQKAWKDSNDDRARIEESDKAQNY